MTRAGVVHLGVGAFLRAHQAVFLDRLRQAGPGTHALGCLRRRRARGRPAGPGGAPAPCARCVADAATDRAVVALLRGYLREAVRTLDPVPGVDLDAYQESLLVRFGSRAVPDTLARLAALSSDRVPGFVLPVLGPRRTGDRGRRRLLAPWSETHPGDVVDRRPYGTPSRSSAPGLRSCCPRSRSCALGPCGRPWRS